MALQDSHGRYCGIAFMLQKQLDNDTKRAVVLLESCIADKHHSNGSYALCGYGLTLSCMASFPKFHFFSKKYKISNVRISVHNGRMTPIFHSNASEFALVSKSGKKNFPA